MLIDLQFGDDWIFSEFELRLTVKQIKFLKLLRLIKKECLAISLEYYNEKHNDIKVEQKGHGHLTAPEEPLF